MYGPVIRSLCLCVDPKALPDHGPKPPHRLPHVPRLGRRVRRAEEQGVGPGGVGLGAEPRAAGDEDALCYARGEDLVFEGEDSLVGTGVLCVI